LWYYNKPGFLRGSRISPYQKTDPEHPPDLQVWRRVYQVIRAADRVSRPLRLAALTAAHDAQHSPERGDPSIPHEASRPNGAYRGPKGNAVSLSIGRITPYQKTDPIPAPGGSDEYVWNQIYAPLDPFYVESHYSQLDDAGRRFQWDNLTGPGGAAKGNAYYEVLGVKGYWRYSKDRMERLIAEGRVAIPPKGKKPRYKRYLDESKGVALQSVWDDLPPVNSQARESLGYPTQKPLALLERIIAVSSNANDIVLDAFCGCGTALVAAQKLKRQWIGIDISPTACRVMAKRLRKDTGLQEDEDLWKIGRGFVVRDLPWSEEKLREIPPFEFENWAVIAIGGIPNKAKVGDMGIDGRIFPVSAIPAPRGGMVREVGEFDFMGEWYPIQVKQKDKAGRPDIDSFEAVMMREDRKKGFFVAFDYSSDAEREIDGFFRRSGKVIIPFTVKEILEDRLAHKLA